MKSSAFYIKCLDWIHAEMPVCQIRHRVFIEQSGMTEEPVSDQEDPTAQHFLLYLNEKQTPVASARLSDNGRIDKIAINTEYRGQQLGTALMRYIHDAARQKNITSTSLHVQLSTTGFYQKLGYVNEGEPFEESGISLQKLQLTIASAQSPIDFNHLVGEKLSVIKAPCPPDYQPKAPRPAADPIKTKALLGESEAISRLNHLDEIIDYIAALISQATEQVFIYSPALTPDVYCAPKVLDAISTMARRNPISQVKILIDDAAPLIKQHHSLLQLQQRINSLITLKCTLKSYPIDSLGVILADHNGWLEIVTDNPLTLSGNFNDPARVKQWHHTLKQSWDHAIVPTDIRRFAL